MSLLNRNDGSPLMTKINVASGETRLNRPRGTGIKRSAKAPKGRLSADSHC